MKKIYILLCAALAALAIVSCNKEPKEEPFIEPEAQTSALSSTAVSLIKEADPNYWGENVKSAVMLYDELRTIGLGNLRGGVKGSIEGDGEEEEYYTLSEDIENWFNSIEDRDNMRFFYYTVRLSLLKGDITVRDIPVEALKDVLEPEVEEIPTREFVYTRSNNPLNLVYSFNGKTYKAVFEAYDAENNLINTSEFKDKGYYDDEDEYQDKPYTKIRRIAVPSKVALHITENGALFIDAVVNPLFNDLNWDDFANYSDEIRANATISIPGYTLKGSDISLTLHQVEGKLELFHGNTSMLALDGKWNYNMMALEEREEIIRIRAAVSPLYILLRLVYATEKLEGTLKLMGGQVILDGEVFPQELIELYKDGDLGGIYDENEARRADSVIQQYLHVNLLYNNGSKVQGRIIYTPVYGFWEDEKAELEAEEGSWKWQWGIRFADKSFKTFDELAQSEDFDAVIGQLAIFKAHGDAIFDEPKEEAKPLEDL